MKGKFLLLVMLAAMVVLASCKKDEEEEPAKPTLSGTVWESVDGTETFTLTFVSDVDFSLHYIDTEDNTVEATTGTYVYNPPNITLITQEDGDTGLVNGNTMTFSSGYIFTKL